MSLSGRPPWAMAFREQLTAETEAAISRLATNTVTAFRASCMRAAREGRTTRRCTYERVYAPPGIVTAEQAPRSHRELREMLEGAFGPTFVMQHRGPRLHLQAWWPGRSAQALARPARVAEQEPAPEEEPDTPAPPTEEAEDPAPSEGGH